MKFFRNHLIAMLIMAASGVIAVIAGVITGLNDGWGAGVLTFIVIAAVGGFIGFAFAAINMMRTMRGPKRTRRVSP
jgi:hypothetical protein